MDNKPLREFPQENEEKKGDPAQQHPGLVTRWIERLAHLGLGEVTLRTLPVSQLPVEIAYSLDGIPRQAELHTTIPSRPRMEVDTYIVQTGDTLFGIAEKFGLKPSTLLFGNYDTLKDTPHSLRPGQELNILPVDGTYYEWQGIENLTTVASFFGVDAESIINFPGNKLDPDAIGDLSNPNIASGTWLVVPGGVRAFNSWSAPIGITRSNPASTRVVGLGACGAINGGNVGFGSFIYPTTEHWLSGTNYSPELGHAAVDFAGSLGNAIYATDAGVVVYAGWNDWGYGNLIILDHGNGWQSLYGHLSQINVSCGASVGQGDVIGLMGSTGNSTGPHLHFELMNTSLGKVNPLDYLPAP
jgi:murein DD-endopeptidase MepM/ murein hydrolase activator NlpD